MIMMSGVKPIQVIKMNPDGSFDVLDASDDSMELSPDDVLDPNDLPKNDIESPCIDKNIPENNWRNGMAGIVIPVKIPNEVEALDPRTAHNELLKQAAEHERAIHERANNNPVNLASQMYDMMSQYHKTMGY